MTNIRQLTDKKLWLAPLAGYTDKAFRQICRECGADVSVSEMVSSDGLVQDFHRSFVYAEFEPVEKPLGIQIFGSEPEIMARSVTVLLDHLSKTGKAIPDFIDINMGCPVKKVVKRGAGSALLLDLPRVGRIVSSVKKELNGTDLFVSAKIRSGWDSSNMTAIEAARIIAANGADFITIHPRTRSQMYSGKSDWNVIQQVVATVDIPVIGNGDITGPDDVAEMYRRTGCSSVMIGRGVLGRPWLFSRIKKYLLTGDSEMITYKRMFEILVNHFELCIKYKGRDRAIREMKAHLCYYTKGIRYGSKIREMINRSKNYDEIRKLIETLWTM